MVLGIKSGTLRWAVIFQPYPTLSQGPFVLQDVFGEGADDANSEPEVKKSKRAT